jgi:hypothetical protein
MVMAKRAPDGMVRIDGRVWASRIPGGSMELPTITATDPGMLTDVDHPSWGHMARIMAKAVVEEVARRATVIRNERPRR